MASIYGLYDVDGNLRYIGKANDPRKRLMSHMRDARRKRTPLYDWINKHSIVPEMRVLEANCEDWQEAEVRLIAEARARGDRLLNLAAGGNEPYCSTDVRVNHPAMVRQRSLNGVSLNDRVKRDPLFAKIWNAKRQVAFGLKNGMIRNEARAKFRLAAKLRPDLFGAWASMPDRIENGQAV